MKTKRVRIAVAMNEDGEWYAYGWRDNSNTPNEEADGVKASKAEEALTGVNITTHFVEADIPIPESTTIEGTVTPK